MYVNNPYQVLRLDSSASLNDVKNAYRNMARIYNGDVAKMREIDAAYDAIVMGANGSQQNSGYTSNSYSYTSDNASDFGDIRAKLNNGRIDDAEMLLDGIPINGRNAEWYYLKGTIQHRRGWLESAAESFKMAHEKEPSNPEYDAAYKQLNREKGGEYRKERREQNENKGCSDPCQLCEALMCADCCCECMGGDLIRCC